LKGSPEAIDRAKLSQTRDRSSGWTSSSGQRFSSSRDLP
jgi:hypothetical protein